MSNIINVCGKPSCCPQIKEEEGMYQIFDASENWKTHWMSKDQIKDLGKAIDKKI